MNNELEKSGFSLIEVLLAVGTLAIGMIFVAGVFPVGIHFSTIATEQTIAAVAADEAFAKVRLYGLVDFSLSPPWPVDPTAACVDFNDVSSVLVNPGKFAYPSTDRDITEKHYFWSALCRRVGLSSVQVTVFVSRRIGAGPVPTLRQVGVSGNVGDTTIEITGDITLINDGYTIVENTTGQIYRVLKRYADDPDTPEREDQVVLLDGPWDHAGLMGQQPGSVWVVPPPVDGGRYPCIAVYQKVIGF